MDLRAYAASSSSAFLAVLAASASLRSLGFGNYPSRVR
jgi:hypothetical protein